MPELIENLQVPVALLVVVSLAIYLVREAAQLLVAGRMKLRDDAIDREIQFLDQRLSEFYLPLRERLTTAKRLYATTQSWTLPDGSYDNNNPEMPIRGGDKTALRKIAVRRVFLPVNQEMERLILDNVHLRDEADATDYAAMLQHLVLWRVFEQAVMDGEIESYDGKRLLPFPATQAAKFNETCARLLHQRHQLLTDLFRYKDPFRRILTRRQVNV